MKKLLFALLAVVAVVIAWGVLRKNQPPAVRLARVTRGTLVSSLPTNGKVEPFEWQAVRAETTGVVRAVRVREGQQVAKGAPLAEIADPAAQSDVEAAEARLAEARANLAGLDAGGPPAEVAEIENSITRARLDLQQARRDRDALARLLEKQAATRAEATAAEDKIRQLEAEIAGLEKRKASLVAKPDLAAARARLQAAEVALKLARQRAGQSIISAPLSGAVYELPVRPGAFLNPGDLVANVGRLDQLRVRVFVDEPELGRVSEGNPVAITWDAMPGKTWQGTVEKKPTTVQPLGSRQVGEVLCTIANPNGELAAGANINAEIRTAVVESAFAIPKEALRRDASGDYVFLLAVDRIERRAVRTGISTITQIQVLDGLSAGDSVALPADVSLKAGDRVTPILP